MQFPKVGGTVRWPNVAGNAVEEKIKILLNKWKTGNDGKTKGKNLTERVFWILTAYTNFGAMCCNLFPGKESGWNNWGSLEDIHNAVHVYVGHGGHMNAIEISAFDPVFWLHHT